MLSPVLLFKAKMTATVRSLAIAAHQCHSYCLVQLKEALQLATTCAAPGTLLDCSEVWITLNFGMIAFLDTVRKTMAICDGHVGAGCDRERKIKNMQQQLLRESRDVRKRVIADVEALPLGFRSTEKVR